MTRAKPEPPGSERLGRLYRDRIVSIMDAILDDQPDALNAARDTVAQTLRNDGIVHVAGSGHSHLIAEEVFYRAGGIAAAQAILMPDLMLHLGAERSTQMEREPGQAARALAMYSVSRGDVVFIVSNSGRNAYPIEFALLAKEAGATTIAITSLAHAHRVASRHHSGKRLFEVTDIVIDTFCAYGDASLNVGAGSARMGPTSTLAGVFILNTLLAEAVAQLVSEGHSVDIYASANSDVTAAETAGGAGSPDTAAIAARWRSRISGL